MGNKSFGVTVRKYHDRVSRTTRVNRFVFLGILLLNILITLILIQRIEIKAGFVWNIVAISLCAFNLVINGILLKLDPASERFRYIAAGIYSLIYGIVFFMVPTFYISVTLLLVLVGSILYYDIRYTTIFTVFMLLINFLQTILQLISGTGSVGMSVEIISLSILVLGSITLYFSVRIGSLFINDTVGAVSDEHRKTEKILSEVLEIAQIVQSDVQTTSKIIFELDDSTKTVNSTVDEIARSTCSVTESVIEQTHRTEAIQMDIRDTEDTSLQVANIVKDTSALTESSFQEFVLLNTQSLEIADINKTVAEAMSGLQDKVESVDNIIGTIVSISGQTNMLALNASIEAARAGEAGKGFAVVANEIRNLAEETRKSSESIATILKELNRNVINASAIVSHSLDLTNRQGKSIGSVSNTIDQVHSNMMAVTENITSISVKVTGVSHSNQSIVDNISQVSAACQEITASTENATAISNQNAILAEKAVTILEEVLAASHKLDKYKN